MKSSMANDLKFDIKNIALRAKGLAPGPVLAEEVEFAREGLRTRSGDLIAAILVVGLCGNATDAPLLETYLHGEGNNLYFEYSLKALCRYLGLIDRYRPLISEWMHRPKDHEDGRRMAAIFVAMEYFGDLDDDELGRHLIDILCDFDDGDRDAARSALVDILDLREQLNDPFGLKFDEWDDETTFIVRQAAKRFGYRDLRIKHSGKVH